MYPWYQGMISSNKTLNVKIGGLRSLDNRILIILLFLKPLRFQIQSESMNLCIFTTD